MFFCGLVSAKRVRVDADYKKWLGPDWKPTYEGTSMCITNHQYQLDVLLVVLLNRTASHLGKKEALSIPLIRHCVEPMDFIMVGRDKKDSKEQRELIVK